MLLDVRTHCRLTLPISSAKGQEKIGGGLFSVVFSVSLFGFAVFAFSSGASLAGPIWVTAARALARAVARAVARLLVRLVLRLKNADILDWSFCFLSIFIKSVGCYACSLGWLSSVSIGRRLSVLNCPLMSLLVTIKGCQSRWTSLGKPLPGSYHLVQNRHGLIRFSGSVWVRYWSKFQDGPLKNNYNLIWYLDRFCMRICAYLWWDYLISFVTETIPTSDEGTWTSHDGLMSMSVCCQCPYACL